MLFKNESLFESYKSFNSRATGFAKTWAECIELEYNSNQHVDIEKSIEIVDKLVQDGPLKNSALDIIISTWIYGQEIKEWYENRIRLEDLLIEI